MLKILKRNQIIIYVLALMLVTAGYLNYTSDGNLLATSSEPDATYNENLAAIGDATLVSSNVESNVVEENTVNQTENQAIDTNVTQTSSSGETDTEEYFTKSKLERDSMYSQMLETYQNIVNSGTVSEEQRSIATQEITNINNTKNQIMICENLLGTKGFENNVVFVNGESVSVVVKMEDELTTEQAAQIQNIISREIGVAIEAISITQKSWCVTHAEMIINF